MNILVTGGTGFIGRHIVWQLLAQGHQVTFTGRNELAAQQVQQLTPQPARWLALEHGHAEAPALLQAATRGVDAVVHTTGLSSPWGKYRDFYRANVQSTEQLVRACEQNGVQRLVHISTPSLYFRFADCLNIREAAPLPAPVNHYAATKALAETVVQQSALPEAVLLRPRAVFGPWDNTLMPRLIRVLQRGAVPTPRQGAALVDLTCVENLADGVLLALTQSLPRARATYNLSNGEPLSIRNLLDQIARQFALPVRRRNLPWPLLYGIASLAEALAHLRPGQEPLLTRYSAGVMSFSQTLNIDCIRAELGYAPRLSIQDGIARYAHWYREQTP